MRRIIMSFVSLAVVVGAAFGLTFITPLRRPPAAAVDLPRTTEQVCPTAGTVLSVGEGDLTHAAIGGAPVTARAGSRSAMNCNCCRYSEWVFASHLTTAAFSRSVLPM